MKKLILSLLMLLTCFGMTSCNTFFAEEEPLQIARITREIGRNNEGDEGFYLVIEYVNPDTPPAKFFIANGKNGKQGETGLEGNGIEKIETSVDEVTKETTVTIKFTDKDVPEASYTIPAGVSLKGVITTPNEDGTSDVEFEFSDGSKSESITLPKGPQGDPGEKGEDGVGILDIKSATAGNKIVLQIVYTNGEVKQVPFDRPNTWLADDTVPNPSIGINGDFYFDTREKVIYKKTSDVWLEVIRLQSSTPQMCDVIFDVNDQGGPQATLNGKKVVKIQEGSYFGMGGEKDLPEPTRPGYIFDGWYLKKNPTTVNGRFTDTTPVFKNVDTGNLTLYANWIEDPEAQA